MDVPYRSLRRNVEPEVQKKYLSSMASDWTASNPNITPLGAKEILGYQFVTSKNGYSSSNKQTICKKAKNILTSYKKLTY